MVSFWNTWWNWNWVDQFGAASAVFCPIGPRRRCLETTSLLFGLWQSLGSILSPTLVNIFVKTLGEVIRGYGLTAWSVCWWYPGLPPLIPRGWWIPWTGISEVMVWMRSNNLKLNHDNTDVLLVRSVSGLGSGLKPVFGKLHLLPKSFPMQFW